MSKIEIKMGSSLDENVDAIVNAANRYLREGGGVCGAIFKKAGSRKLQEACDKYKTPLKDGDSVITPAFKIKNAKYIIHAVGPDFNYKGANLDDLVLAYYNSLIVLKESNLHSISFPLISSGIFAGSMKRPSYVSAKSCLKAYNRFIEEYPDYEIDVRICAFSRESYEEVKEIEKEFK